MGNRNLKFAAVLQINSRSRAFANKASSSTETAMRRVLKAAEKIAKANVAKGKGPGPHPHFSPHEDTGNLMRSVQSAIWLQGFLTEGSLFTNLDYGTYLEVGWRTKAGTFVRYPWMRPAMLEAIKLLPKFAAEAFRTQMQDLDEETIVGGAELDSWGEAAQRWAAYQQTLRGRTAAPETPPPFQPSFTPAARKLHREAPRKKGGRPRDTSELADDIPRNRNRVRTPRTGRVSRVDPGDISILRQSQKSGEQRHRSEIDPLKASMQYEERRRRREEGIARRAQARHEAQNRLDAVNKALQDKTKLEPLKKKRKRKP